MPSARILQPFTAASLIQGLRGNPETGMCRCPAHDDRTPSLHVSDGAKGVVFKCHAGCDQDSVLAALKSRGLWPGGGRSGPPPMPARGAAEDEYNRFRRAYAILRAAAIAEAGQPVDYLAARGVDNAPPAAMLLPAKESCRLFNRSYPAMVCPIVGPKGLQGAHVTFLNRGATSKIGADTPRQSFGKVSEGYVPLGFADPEKPLVVGEGIETTLSAMQITGFPGVAATSAGNLAKITLPPCSEVIIAADNDKPGRRAAKALARRMRLRGTPVRIAVPDGPDKYDWNDALRDGADPESLRKAIMSAERRRPVSDIALGVEDFMNLEFPPREYLMRPWLTTSSINMLHADRGVGKSMLAISIAAAVARGAPLMRWTCGRSVPALYVDGELHGDLLQKRLSWFRPAPTNAELMIINRDRVTSLRRRPLDLANPEDRELLDGIIERNDFGLIILDSILTLFSSDTQTDAQPWKPVQDWAYGHRDAGRCVIFIHHESKGGKQFGTMLHEVQLDTTVRLERHKVLGDDGSAVRITFPKARDFYGADADAVVARFKTASGVIEWTCGPPAADSRTRVLELMNEGWKQKDIAKELDISEPAVSQHVKNLREAGEL